MDGLVYQIGVDIGNPLHQFKPSFFRFRIMNDHMDWNAFSGNTTHLPATHFYELSATEIP